MVLQDQWTTNFGQMESINHKSKLPVTLIYSLILSKIFSNVRG